MDRGRLEGMHAAAVTPAALMRMHPARAMRRGAPLFLLAALLMTSAAQAKSYRHTSYRDSDPDFEWTARIPAGKVIEIKGVNGAIMAEPTSGDEVEIVASKHAKRSDPRDVRIEVIEHEGGVTICAVYPGAGNSCEPGQRSHSNTRNNDVVVDFHVRVPAGVGFMGYTVNGGIEAEDLEGPIEARTVNGSVRISTTGTAMASTVNGSVSATVGSARWNDELNFVTVNGGITVTFPKDVSAGVHASTVNGSISTDFPLTVRGRILRKHLDGRIGDGRGGELSLSTVNGSIRLLAAEE